MADQPLIHLLGTPPLPTFAPLDFDYLWPGYDDNAAHDNTSTVAITHKTTGTIVHYHAFILKWMREYCAHWGRRFEGHDETALIDAIASLDMSADAFKSFWRMWYDGRVLIEPPRSTESDDGDSSSSPSEAPTHTDVTRKRTYWVSLLCNEVIAPGVIYMKAMFELLRDVQWLRDTQQRICNAIQTLLSPTFVEHRMTEYASSDKEDGKKLVPISTDWFFDVPERYNIAVALDDDSDDQTALTDEDWAQVGYALGDIVLTAIDNDDVRDDALKDDYERAWREYSVALISHIVQGVNKYIQTIYRKRFERRLRVRQVLLESMCYMVHPHMSPERILSMSMEVNANSFCYQHHLSGQHIDSNDMCSPTQWYRVMAQCMSRYASLHIFKANPAVLERLDAIRIGTPIGSPRRANNHTDGGGGGHLRDFFAQVQATHFPPSDRRRLQLTAPETNFVVTIEGDTTGANTFAVHDFILMQWAYFQRLMRANMTEAQTRRLVLPADFNPVALRLILGIMYGVDLGDSFATNNLSMMQIEESVLHFILNECMMTYDLATLHDDDDNHSDENATSSSSCSCDDVDLVESLTQRLKSRDLLKAVNDWKAQQQERAAATSSLANDDDANVQPMEIPTMASGVNWHTDRAAVIDYAAKAHQYTERGIAYVPPNLIKPKAENAIRLAEQFAALIDLLIVVKCRRDQMVVACSYMRMVDRNASVKVQFPKAILPSIPELAFACRSMVMDLTTATQPPDDTDQQNTAARPNVLQALVPAAAGNEDGDVVPEDDDARMARLRAFVFGPAAAHDMSDSDSDSNSDDDVIAHD